MVVGIIDHEKSEAFIGQSDKEIKTAEQGLASCSAGLRTRRVYVSVSVTQGGNAYARERITTYGANNGTGSLHALWPAGPTDATRNQYLRPLTIELNVPNFFVVLPIT